MELQEIQLSQLRSSPHNPRHLRDDDPGLRELADSIAAVGVLQPLVVRALNKAGGVFEIVAGERRHRAAKLAGLESAPATVRELTDEQALEITVTENLQREDLSPLEEAQGFHQLLRLPGSDVAKVAARLGRSVRYVYDRLKLLSLTDEAQKLLNDDRITAGHAILLARLGPTDQKKAIKTALFTREDTLFDPRDDAALIPAGGFRKANEKVVSVRELQGWVDEHVRFDAAQADAMLFPETVQTVQQAVEVAEKVVSITLDYFVQPDAKDGTRTFGPKTWKRADGRSGSKTCEHSVTGVIVAGHGRGEAFKVCTEKKKCAPHWGAEQKRAAKARTEDTKTGAGFFEKQQKRQRIQREKEERLNARWNKALPAILDAIADRVKKSKAAAGGLLATALLAAVRLEPWAIKQRGLTPSAAFDLVPVGKSADDLVRHLAFVTLVQEATDYDAPWAFPKVAKRFGVDALKILEREAPETPEPAETAAKQPAKAAKKAKGKKGR
jgi:ParB family chromosome partitioning protein